MCFSNKKMICWHNIAKVISNIERHTFTLIVFNKIVNNFFSSDPKHLSGSVCFNIIAHNYLKF